MGKLNAFEIRARVIESGSETAVFAHHFYWPDDGRTLLFPEIWIDGKLLQEQVAIDFLALLDTTHKLKQSVWKSYSVPNIFTCGCGVPGCAGIEDTIMVFHDGPHVIWNANLPLVSKQRNTEHPYGRATEFRFLKSEMVGQCRAFVQAARSISDGKLSNVRIPVYKDSLDFLLRTSRFKWARKGTG